MCCCHLLLTKQAQHTYVLVSGHTCYCMCHPASARLGWMAGQVQLLCFVWQNVLLPASCSPLHWQIDSCLGVFTSKNEASSLHDCLRDCAELSWGQAVQLTGGAVISQAAMLTFLLTWLVMRPQCVGVTHLKRVHVAGGRAVAHDAKFVGERRGVEG